MAKCQRQQTAVKNNTHSHNGTMRKIVAILKLFGKTPSQTIVKNRFLLTVEIQFGLASHNYLSTWQLYFEERRVRTSVI